MKDYRCGECEVCKAYYALKREALQKIKADEFFAGSKANELAELRIRTCQGEHPKEAE